MPKHCTWEGSRVLFKRMMFLCAISLFELAAVSAQAPNAFAPSADATNNFQTEVLLTGLDNPTGLALQPTLSKSGAYEFYLAESGAGRVLRVSTEALDAVDEVVTELPTGSLGSVQQHRVGPISLAFLSRSTFVLGTKQPTGSDTLISYALPKDVATANAQLGQAAESLNQQLTAQVDELHLFGLAVVGKTCFATTGGKAGQGWILKSDVDGTKLSALQPFIDVGKLTQNGGPAGIAMIPPPRPAYLVVACMGSDNVPQDSSIAFFVPASGELAMQLATGLHDIVSLAYSPSGQLYAADFCWHDDEQGGVYRLDDAMVDGRTACRATKIAAVVRPFCLAFSPDGALYVTAFGKGENVKQGSLLRISGSL